MYKWQSIKLDIQEKLENSLKMQSKPTLENQQNATRDNDAVLIVHFEKSLRGDIEKIIKSNKSITIRFT